MMTMTMMKVTKSTSSHLSVNTLIKPLRKTVIKIGLEKKNRRLILKTLKLRKSKRKRKQVMRVMTTMTKKLS